MSRSMTVTSTKFHAFRLFCQSVSSSSSRASHSRTKRQSFQAGYSFLGLHSSDGAVRHEVAINEIIQTPRLQPGPESRACRQTTRSRRLAHSIFLIFSSYRSSRTIGLLELSVAEIENDFFFGLRRAGSVFPVLYCLYRILDEDGISATNIDVRDIAARKDGHGQPDQPFNMQVLQSSGIRRFNFRDHLAGYLYGFLRQ